MIPRLQRFYGGDPEQWTHISSRWLWVYTRMLPALQARESIQRINEVSYAFGSMDKQGGKMFIRELERVAAGDTRVKSRAYRPKSMADMQRLLGGSSTAMIME